MLAPARAVIARHEVQVKLQHIKVEHIWAMVFFTVGLLMLAYFALKLLAGVSRYAAGQRRAQGAYR